MPRVLILMVLATLAATAAGCGGKSAAPGVAQIGTSTTSTTPSSQSNASSRESKEEAVRRFAVCMRANGVPQFPDPKPVSGGGMTLSIDGRRGLDPDSPLFKAAEKKCQKYMPNGGKVDPAAQAKAQAEMLKFSACMRSHGLPNFPDPTFSGGGIKLSIGRADGINPRSPVFQAAQKACQSLRPGPKGSGGGSTELRQGPAAGSSAP